ncbi:MAG: PepSY domain-containing protein [Burkholderiales bacterium]
MSLTTHQIRLIRRWHMSVGLFAVTFLLFLVITGFVLNHSEALGLDRGQIKAQWLARWYGLQNEIPLQAYACGEHQVVWANGKWTLGHTVLGDDLPPPRGAVQAGGACTIAGASTLYVFRADGRLVEKISGASLPGAVIEAIGVSDQRIVLKMDNGVYSSADWLQWRNENGQGVSWAQPQALTSLQQQEFASVLAPSLPLQKILQDFHSGRILGRYGPLFMDLIGLCVMGLGLSGVWMFLRIQWLKKTMHKNK